MKLTNLLSVAFFAFIGGNLRYLIGQALGLGPGLIGAFTTFSTFSLELGKLLLAHAWGAASAYFLLSSIGGLTLVWLGYLLAQRLRGLNRWC